MGFLQLLGTTFKAVPNETKTTKRSSLDRNPVNADLRLFKNGAIYPSVACASDFALEYGSKGSVGRGIGFDIIDSRTFFNTKEMTPAFLMIAPVPKNAGKVDLFAQTTYNEDGTPYSDVLTQGSTNFGKQLWTMLKEVYGIEQTDFIDLVIEDSPEIAKGLKEATNGIYNLPKSIERGALKGTPSYVRRENLDIYVLLPQSLAQENASVTTKDEAAVKEESKVKA